MAELKDDEQALWRGFLSWSESVVAEVGTALTAASGLSVSDFQVLIRLDDAAGEQDQKALGTVLEWSASRLSHQLSRMEGRGLVRRTEVGHGRLMRVTLTASGSQVLSDAKDALGQAVREHFLDPLKPAERRSLSAIVARR